MHIREVDGNTQGQLQNEYNNAMIQLIFLAFSCTVAMWSRFADGR